MILQYTLFLFGLIWSFSIIKTQSIFNRKVGLIFKLFESNSKYESGSGWPSFYESLPNVFETKTDHHIGYARTEYHCKNCGGHHGHIFDDGPKPTGKRFCNNGACLNFKPKK